MIVCMADENKPNPIEDVTKGLGLLFRAAKTAVERLPTDRLENIVTEGAKEVGKAIETVTEVIDREVLGNKPPASPSAHASDTSNATNAEPPHVNPSADSNAPSAHSQGSQPPQDDAPKGPRIA